jgi:hypothetical protein
MEVVVVLLAALGLDEDRGRGAQQFRARSGAPPFDQQSVAELPRHEYVLYARVRIAQ